jgi:hypothetical protein
MRNIAKLVVITLTLLSFASFSANLDSKLSTESKTYSPLLCAKLSGSESLGEMKMFFSPDSDRFSFTVPGSIGTTKRFSFQKSTFEMTILTRNPQASPGTDKTIQVNCLKDALSCLNAAEMFLGQMRSASFAAMNASNSTAATKFRIWDVSYCASEFLLDYQGRLTTAINSPGKRNLGAR